MSTAAQVRERIDEAPMSSYQWLVVALCVVLNTLDGFDVMAMAFTAPAVRAELGLSGTEIGLLLSAGLVGMTIGSLFLAPLSDRLGRRPVVLGSVALSAVGMLGSALAPTALALGATRVVTGLGVGAILACTNVLAGEFSNARRRGLAIGLYAAGYGVGATVGGLAAVGLQESFGWRGVFWTGALLSVVALALLAALLPESVDHLLHDGRASAVVRADRILARMCQEPSGSSATSGAGAGAADASHPPARHVGTLLRPGLRRPTLLVWLSFFAVMYGFYFVNSWTPTLLAEAGLTGGQAASAGMALAIGGAVGSVLYGVVTARRDAATVLVGFVVLAAVSMVGLVLATPVLAVALVVGVVVGALVNGCVAGLYTVTPGLYDPRIRGTGMGWGIGVGRIGAIVAPLVTGRLVDAGWGAVQLYVAAACVLAVAAVAVALLGRARTREALPVG